jgi:hypothetical protein
VARWEILNLEQLFDALLGRQSFTEIDVSHARLDARWECVWQRRELARFLGQSMPAKRASERGTDEVLRACGFHRCLLALLN